MDRADVLIVTAVQEEYDAVLQAGGGAGAWQTQTGPMGLAVAFRDVDAGAGGKLTIAVTQALGMGAANAVAAAAGALQAYKVRCLAMCGVCAGRRDDTALGDVIIADRVWQYDAGKHKAQTVKKKRVVEQQEDIEMYRLNPPAWKQAAQRFKVDPKAPWLARRPRSYEAQGDWILERLLHDGDPQNDKQRKTKCANWDAALARLYEKKFLKKRTLTLTTAGKKHIEHVLRMNHGELPKAKRLRIHVAPIASGNQVMQDDEIFERLSQSVRKVRGVEMEAAAIGMLAYTAQLPCSVVMKAVMDHADANKSDNFKRFAAEASAECLLAFVKQHVPPRNMGDDPILTPGTSDLPKHAGPAALLNARHQVVPFYGREQVLDELRRWCQDGGDGTRARLIHAEGGMGKTRLVIELCRQMRESGWRAGFLREGNKLAELRESHHPVLVALDYAESRPDLRETLAGEAGRHRKKALRIVLLARSADQWWTDLLSSSASVTDMFAGEEPLVLPSVTPDQETEFRAAVKAFSKKEYKGVPPSLTDPKYQRVLYVHAAALATAQGREVHVDALMKDTLEHEERFWREQLRDRGRAGERNALDDMRLAVATLTLRGGARDKAEAEDIIRDKGLMLLLHDLYPGRAGQQYIGGLEPDLLGEAMVWRTLSKEGSGAGSYLDRAFSGADPQAIRTGLTVLGRLSEDHEEAAGWIASVLARDVAGRAMEALAAAKTVGERTAHAALGMELARALQREGTVELARRLEAALPHPDRTVSLREVGRWVLEKPLADMPNGGALEERARLLNNVGAWQRALGDREAALASAQEATGLYRKLAQARPKAFRPDLAMSLNNLGMMQSDLGDRETALASMQEAVDLYRKLAQARPGAFLPYLAGSLDNLGTRQNDLGDWEAAMASTQEAVDLYRKLAQERPEAFRPDLAMSLNSLGVRQSDLGDREAALASTQEAVDLYRKLVQARPEAFLPDLAISLNNLGLRQNALGDREAALASAQEAVDLRRKLAQARPEAFLPALASSLDNLGTMQSDLGHRESALASTQEAVDLQRKLAQARPEAFLPYLAGSLNNLGLWQNALGQPEAALVSAEEALNAIWSFFLRLPAAFERNTGIILGNLRERLEALGRAPSPELLQRIATFDARRVALRGPSAGIPQRRRRRSGRGSPA